MASTLQHWILPVAQKEIFDPEYPPRPTIERNGRSYSGSAIAVQLTEKRRVQIIDFNGRHRHPLNVTVSDGNIKVRATFSRECTQEFSKHHSRKFTDRTEGGIICIEDYTMVFQPVQNLSKALTLEVSQFSLVGSEGSSPFGQPLNIEEHPEVHEAILKLRHLMGRAVDEGLLKVDGVSPIQSQSNSFYADRQKLSPEPGMMDSFATQVVPAAHDNRPNLQPTPKMLDALSILQQVPLKKDNLSSKDQAEILRLLETRTGRKIPEIPDYSVPRSLGGEISILEEMPNKTSVEDYSIATAESQLPQHGPAASSAEDNEKENSQDSSRLEKPQASKLPGPSLTAEDDTSSMPQILIFDDASDGDLFKGLKRVPRSYVRVNEKQKAILARNNSWFRPGYNDGSSYASNVPSDILNGLTLFASRIAEQSVVAAKGANTSTNDLDESNADNSNAGGDSDLEDTPENRNSVEITGPHSSTIRTSHTTDDLSAGTTNGGSGQDQIGSSLNVQANNLNEAENEEGEYDEDEGENDEDDEDEDEEAGNKDEENEEAENEAGKNEEEENEDNVGNEAGENEDEDGESEGEISWDETNDGSNPEVTPTPEYVEMDVDIDQPQIRAENSPITTVQRPTPPHRPVTFPSSSPDSEDEMPTEVAHAIDDPFDEQSDDQVEDHAIQVGQTPVSHAQRGTEPTGPQAGTRGVKRNHEDISSDSIIPASASDGGAQSYPQSSGNAEPKSQSTTNSKDSDRNEAQVLTTQVSAGESIAPDKDGVPGHVRFTEHGASQSSIVSPIKSTYDVLQGVSSGSQMATPTTYQVPEPPKSSLPHPQTAHGNLEKHIQRQSATEFSQVQYAFKDADKAAGDLRHNFKAQLTVMAEASSIPSVVPSQEKGTATSSTSQAQANSTQEDGAQATQKSHSLDEQLEIDISPAGKATQPSHRHTALADFLATYPGYKGSEAQFINGLVYIEWLVNNRGKSFLRKSLWDDLIRVLADDYMDYIKQSSADGKKMDCLEFYNELDQDPVFKKQVITPSSLQDAISSFDPGQIDVVRRTYNLPGASTLPTTDQLGLSTVGDDVRAATPIHLSSSDESPAPPVPVESATPMPISPVAVAEQVAGNEPDPVIPSPENIPVQAAPSSTARRMKKPRFFETHSQFQGERLIDARDAPDAAVEPVEASPARREQSTRRSLPWKMQDETVEAEMADVIQTRSGPASPQISRHPQGLRSNSPRSSLPNPPAKKRRQIGLDHVSEEELAFLQHFARRRMLGEGKGKRGRE